MRWRSSWAVIALMVAAVRPGGAEEIDRSWKPPQASEWLLLGSAEAFVAADAVSTLVALRRPDAREVNPLLGPRPSAARVVAMSAAGGLALGAMWYALPPRQRWVAPVFAMIAESLAIAGNIGVACAF